MAASPNRVGNGCAPCLDLVGWHAHMVEPPQISRRCSSALGHWLSSRNCPVCQGIARIPTRTKLIFRLVAGTAAGGSGSSHQPVGILHVTMPPVTTWLVNDRALQISGCMAILHVERGDGGTHPLRMLGIAAEYVRITKLGSCFLAMGKNTHVPANYRGGDLWIHQPVRLRSPLSELFTQPPLVMNTRSLSLKAIVRVAPSASVSRCAWPFSGRRAVRIA